MMSKNEIFKIAEYVKNYVEKHKKLPTKVSGYSWPQIWYILSYAIVYPGKDLNVVPNVKSCSNAAGDKINEKIYPSDFKDQAKRILQFIKQNGKVSNYVVSVKSKKKIRPRLSIYAEARIVVWYYAHKNVFPNYCTYDSSKFTSSVSSSNSKKVASNKKYGRATKHGCDNMGQNTGYFCGPHGLQEIFRNLTGIVVPQSTIAKWAGTTSSGTDHAGLNTAVAMFNKTYKQNLKVTWYNFNDLGWSGVKKILESTNQDLLMHLLYRRKWGHYENPNSINGSNVKVQNSLGDNCTGSCYCGYVENRSQSEHHSYIKGISQKSVMVVTRG